MSRYSGSLIFAVPQEVNNIRPNASVEITIFMLLHFNLENRIERNSLLKVSGHFKLKACQ
jgi:hypothetical protein